MKNVIIACETLRDELTLAMTITGRDYDMLWIDTEYHIDPNKLRNKLQEEIDKLADVDNLLFAYGCCGSGLVGLKASTANLIIPKTDDCISMILSRPGISFERHKQTYFLTKGWLNSSKSMLNEFLHAQKRYGEERAKRIFGLMLKHYKYLMLIDTGAYQINECLAQSELLANTVNLELIVEKGDTWLLEKLLLGSYDEDFCYIPKGGTVKLSDFGYAGMLAAQEGLRQ